MAGALIVISAAIRR